MKHEDDHNDEGASDADEGASSEAADDDADVMEILAWIALVAVVLGLVRECSG